MPGIPFLRIVPFLSLTVVFGAILEWCGAALPSVDARRPSPTETHCLSTTPSKTDTFLCAKALQEGYGLAIYQGEEYFFFRTAGSTRLYRPRNFNGVWSYVYVISARDETKLTILREPVPKTQYPS